MLPGLTGHASNPVNDASLTFRAGTVPSAVPMPISFDTLPDDLHTAVLADRRHTVDSAGERIKLVP